MAVSISDLTSAVMEANGVATITTPAFTITSNANVAGILCFSAFNADQTSITGSIGGVSGTPITGTDSGSTVARRSLQFQVIAPPSGSQTGTMSWTNPGGGAGVVLGAIATSGVDQTTPCNNGTFATGTTTTSSVTVTSNNGDLTVANESDSSAGAPSGSTQTELWNKSAFANGAGSRGPGTGNTTHAWTVDAAAWANSGSNFKAAATSVPDSISPANITSSAGRFIGWTV